MANRSSPPEINPITQIAFPNYEKIILDNGIPLYLVEAGTQPVVKLEAVFHAGRPYEEHQLVARATARLLKEGSQSFSASQIAEKIDFFGASISVPVNLDTSGLVFYSLSKHVSELIPLWSELLTSPGFPQNELNSLIKNNVQRLKIDLEKNDVLAYRAITENLFGEKHPYGYNSVEQTYLNLNRDWLKNHFERHYIAENCSLFLSGLPEANTVELINRFIGNMIPKGTKSVPYYPKIDAKINREDISRKNSVQSALRIGKILFPRSHEDYPAFFVLNTILGGYFGSRLMANLREDKGLTYNIYSSLDAMHQEGAFLIGAEVGTQNSEKALQQIFHELDKLRTEKVGEKELKMIKNYLSGSFLSMVDGPFNLSEIIRTSEVENLGRDYFNKLIATVTEVNSEQLKELAEKYLSPESMSVVIAGA